MYCEYITYVHHAVALYQSQRYDEAALSIQRAFAFLGQNHKPVAD